MEPITTTIRAEDAEGFVKELVQHGVDAAVKRYGGQDSSLSQTVVRDPRRFGHKGAYPRIGKNAGVALKERLYEEVGIYGTIVDTYAEDTWSTGYNLHTANARYHVQAENHLQDNGVFEAWEDADKHMQQHGHAWVYFRLEHGSGDPADPVKGAAKVIGTEAISPLDVSRVIQDEDANSESYKEVRGIVVNTGTGQRTIHISRLQLVREFPKRRHAYEGVPRMRRVMDDILGYENFKWATYESYWQRAAPYLQAVINPDAKLTDADAANVRGQLDKLQSGIIQKIIAENFELKPIQGASALVSPKAYGDVAKEAMAVSSRIPMDRLFGSQQGQLASAQEDSRRYHERQKRRKQKFALPLVLDYLGRLSDWGELSPTPDDLVFKWGPLDQPRVEDEAETEKARAEALKVYKDAGLPFPANLVQYDPALPPIIPGAEPEDPDEPEPEEPPIEDPAPDPGEDSIKPPRRPPAAAEVHRHELDPDASKIEIPELKPLEKKAEAGMMAWYTAQSNEVLSLFDEDPRFREEPNLGAQVEEALRVARHQAFMEAVQGGRGRDVDPDDSLVSAVLAWAAAPGDFQDLLFSILQEAALLGGSAMFKTLNRDDVFQLLDDTDLKALRTLADQVGEKQATDLTTAIRQGIAQGLVDGDSLTQLRRRVIDVMDVASNKATMIARTESMRGWNKGANLAIKQAGLERFRFESYDSACTICAPLDGETFSVNDALNVPPLHPHCRCTITAVVNL